MMNGNNKKPLIARNTGKQKKDKYYQITVIAGSEAEPYKKGSPEYELILDMIKPENRAEFTPVFLGKKELPHLPNVKITEGENDVICVYQMGELSEEQKTAICVAVAKYTQAESLLFYDKGLTESNESNYVKRIRNGEASPEVLKMVESKAKPTIPQRKRYLMDDSGLYLAETKTDKNGNEYEATPIFLCNEAYTKGIGIDEDNEHSTIIEWVSVGDNKRYIEPISNKDFGKAECWDFLRSKGLIIPFEGKANRELATYWQIEAVKNDRWNVTNKTGWQHGVFFLPNGDRLADTGKNVLLKNKSASAKGYSVSGSIESWRDNIAKYAQGNPIFMLALACGFTAPILHLLKADSFGVHIYGKSTGGKTTAGNIASSIWGYCEEMRLTWNSTKLGLINEALAHNDNLLPMDEITTADPMQLQSIAYDVFSGVSKLQGHEKGGNRTVKRWNVLAFSTGEKDLDTMLKNTNTTNTKTGAKAGELVRLLNIPMQQAENWHEFNTAKDFADNINEQCKNHYGVVGREWIEYLAKNNELLQSKSEYYAKEWQGYLLKQGDITQQAYRVARRFALLETSLQLSTQFTGFKQQDIKKALTVCFDLWLDNFGRGDKEDEQIIETLKKYISTNYPKFIKQGTGLYNSEFLGAILEIKDDKGTIIREDFYINTEIFDDVIMKGFNRLEALKTLEKSNLLKRKEKDRYHSRLPANITPHRGARGYLIQGIFED
ncbi:DUF927 domain-containing protein [Phocoenobacter skyensis]|uniref:DUF927 domain-containing protein n=1 Tax=Phocoenobacter skyensis TaxID=97481 RepID=A0ABT9JIR1_9PAST|nr:DUF927 domain-containing protein [Pasteurella skyensis]MDP8078401.1 DUF927 domain-containing protein [Pasteurella skyensis]MDP8084507.1 DUF927 domain-containing protein [Pasteurella skyensis]